MDKNRKDQLRALFGTVDTTPDPEQKTEAMTEHAPSSLSKAPLKPRTASGAVKAMGLSLGGISRELEDARRIKESFEGTERVIDLDPALVEGSFIEDRLSDASPLDESFEELVESIRSGGQQVPILVRPHPERHGHYQTAYGHRRLRAAAQIGRPVQAIVRDLTDTQLVLAQGKENTERRDLSFIERAFFASNLMERGFERGLVQDALSIDKAEMTRFLQVASAVPAFLMRAIGPAPKIGRPRWVKFAELLQSGEAEKAVLAETATPTFKAADSNKRFNRVFEVLLRRDQGQGAPITAGSVSQQPNAIAWLQANDGRQVLTFGEKAPAGFAEFVTTELDALLRRFNKLKRN